MANRTTGIYDTPDGIRRLGQALREADAVVIGAGAGLSTAAGFSYTGERLARYFGDFAEKYRIPDMYSGGFFVMNLPPEEMWAYWSRYIWINRYAPVPNDTYGRLVSLVKDKDYFILTTNVDHCFQKAGFSKERLFYTQGDYGLWQCSTPCHEKTYDNEEGVRKMVLAQGFSIDEAGELLPPEKAGGSGGSGRLSMRIPQELLPVCPVCGEPMSMNLRADATFVEDQGWHEAAERYQLFLKEHQSRKTLFLEAGVGFNTPGIVKFSFWKMTNQWPDATYACLNKGEAYAPEEIRDKSICINGDIREILRKL